MTAPRAVGVRASYDAMPGVVRDWVDDALGSPVVEAVDQVGGMSPGCATRLRCADGTRAFVKAVGTDLNPDTPTLFRREITVLSLLGSHALWGDLLASYDDGERVALLLEDVDGTHPDLADDTTMEQLLAATDELGDVMRARVDARSVDHLVGGTLMQPGLTDQHAVLRNWLPAFEALERLPDAPVPAWVRAGAGEWHARLAALAGGRSDTLVHWDIRVDNLLQRPTGEIVFLDWGAAGVGEAWLDPLLARLERVDQPWFDRSLAASPALAAIGDDAVTTWLVGLGTNLAVRAVTAVDVNLPTLAEFRRVESARFLGAAARRLGVGP
ncbi:phosphotransferase [Nocardioides antri]|uniref:Phosphotransferase n=1 Tax=Nocardioides antri TaxID=2607659 RepID=A0A5B1M0B2_9ACTN|nr:phosphotransferase [Nocardioides antri]KAA1426214.1 phosphotransferase [Nocardioides antri]